MRSALMLAPSCRCLLDSSPSNEALPRRLKTQLFQRSPTMAGRFSSVPRRTVTCSSGGTSSLVSTRSSPTRSAAASWRRMTSSVSELVVTVFSVYASLS